MKINLIVATTENGVIGKNGDMPWSMPADLVHFKKVTTLGESNVVIMGRKTYDSIGRALPGRINLVVTSNRNTEQTSYIDAQVFNSIEDCLDLVKGYEFFRKTEHDVYIIGGASIYNQFMEMGIVDKIHHTLIHTSVDGDTFFKIPEGWSVISEKPFKADEENSYDYTFRILTKDLD